MKNVKFMIPTALAVALMTSASCSGTNSTAENPDNGSDTTSYPPVEIKRIRTTNLHLRDKLASRV